MELLEDKLNALSLHGRRKLHVDGLNFAEEFGFQSDCHAKAVLRAPKRIRLFCEAARESGWDVVVFIDDVTQTQATMSKWRQRRCREVRTGVRNVPQGMSIMMAECFSRCGVEVRFSFEADKEDTMAAHAQSEGASILSSDHNFFRYRGSTFMVYDSFTRSSFGSLTLNQHAGSLKQWNPCRDLMLSPLPKTHSKVTNFLDHDPPRYLRGAPSPLIRVLLRNPHGAVVQLRQALYARMGMPSDMCIQEEYPEWDEERQEVVWTQQDVSPDGLKDKLLDHPHEAFADAFPPDHPMLKRPLSERCSANDWRNHMIALHAVVYELCSLASGVSFLELMTTAAQELLPNHATADKNYDKPNRVASPAYSYACLGCRNFVHMTQKEVDWFMGKKLSLPKRCKACRSRP